MSDYRITKYDDVLTRDVIEYLLFTAHLSVREIADKIETDARTIYNYIDLYGIDTRTIKNNEIILHEDHAEVVLTNGEITLIDLEDVEEVKKYTWRHTPAGCRGQRKLYHATMSHRDKNTFMDGNDTKLHRFLMKPEHNKIVVDHINHNSLDNRRQNLRLCTNQENLRGRRTNLKKESGLRGVRYRNGGYHAEINANGQYYFLGSFKTAYEAAYVYNRKAVDLFGDFAFVNEIPEGIIKEEPKRTTLDIKGRLESGMRGIRKSGTNTYSVNIGVNGKAVFLGTFYDKLAAIEAYNSAALKYHGDKAVLNPIPENHIPTKKPVRGARVGETGLRGVSKKGDKYWARITVEGKRKDLGLFDNPIDAAIAWNLANEQHNGPDAFQNPVPDFQFLEGDY